MTTQIQGAAGEGKDVDAVDELRVCSEPRRVHALSSPDHADGDMRIAGREDGVIDIEPVLFDGGAFGGMKEDAQVADRFLVGDGSPKGDRGGEVHRFGTGFLVVPVAEIPVSGRPGMPGIGIMSAEEGEPGIGAVPVVGILDE